MTAVPVTLAQVHAAVAARDLPLATCVALGTHGLAAAWQAETDAEELLVLAGRIDPWRVATAARALFETAAPFGRPRMVAGVGAFCDWARATKHLTTAVDRARVARQTDGEWLYGWDGLAGYHASMAGYWTIAAHVSALRGVAGAAGAPPWHAGTMTLDMATRAGAEACRRTVSAHRRALVDVVRAALPVPTLAELVAAARPA